MRSDGDLDALPPSLLDVLLSRVDALPRTPRSCCAPPPLPAAPSPTGSSPRWPASRRPSSTRPCARRWRTTCSSWTLAGTGTRFRHALTRDAVYEDMLPGERVRLHAAYGEALARDPGLAGDPAALPATLAYHWYAALDLPRALPAAIDAARAALTSYGPAGALRYLERALEIWPRVEDAEQRTGLDQVEVSRLAADAAYRAGALDRANSLIADALAELPDDAKPERRALLMERSAMILREQGESAAAAQTLREALALLPADQVTRARALVLAALAGALMRADDMPRGSRSPGGPSRRRGRPGRGNWKPTLPSRSACSSTPPASRRPCAAPRGPAAGSGVRGGQSLDRAARLHEPLGRPGDVRPARRGRRDRRGRHELAVSSGVVRTLGSFLIGNRAEPLLRLGEWAEVDQLTAEGLRALPEGVFAGYACSSSGPSSPPCAVTTRTPAASSGSCAGPSATRWTRSSRRRCGTSPR